MENKQQLDKIAWINAGFRALCERGPAGLKAEPLARELGVSKGSFYWHFANLAAFREAMIEHWVALATQGIIEVVEAHSQDPAERLRHLVHMATEPPPAAVGGQGAEGAIRCWGRADIAVGERLNAVDTARIDYCEKLFLQLGVKPRDAQIRGRLLYAALIGLEALNQAGLVEMREDLQAFLDTLL